MSNGSGELRAQISRTQVSAGSLDLSPTMPSTDDAELSALAPSARDLQATLDASEAELTELMTELSEAASARHDAEVALRPFLMLPAECWDSEHQRMLVETLDLTPTQSWNVLPLAATADDAEALGIRQHPLLVTPASIEQARGFVDDIIAMMLTSFERAAFGGDTVDAGALQTARTTAHDEIVALGRTIASVELGAATVDDARRTFFND